MSFPGNFPRFNKVSADGKEIYFGDPDVDGSYRLKETGGSIHLEKRVATIWTDQGDIVTAVGGGSYNVITSNEVDFDADVNYLEVSANVQLDAINLANGKETIVILKNTSGGNVDVDFNSNQYGVNGTDDGVVIPPNANNVFRQFGANDEAFSVLLKDNVGNAFPTGIDGDLTILNGQTVQLNAGDIKDYDNIDIQAGGTLEILDPSNTGNLTEIYARTSFNVDGQILARGITNAGYSKSGVTASGYSYSYTLSQAGGGGGGQGGYFSTLATVPGNGGGQSSGIGGGGGAGAGWAYDPNQPAGSPPYSHTGAAMSGSIGGNGASGGGSTGPCTLATGMTNPQHGSAGSPPGVLGCTSGFTGNINTMASGLIAGGNSGGAPGTGGVASAGYTPAPRTISGSTMFTSWTFAGSGGSGGSGGGQPPICAYCHIVIDGVTNPRYTSFGGGGSGGGGGWRGNHGMPLFLKCVSGITGSGIIDTSGSSGFNGGAGGSGRRRVMAHLTDTTATVIATTELGFSLDREYTAGNGGGGGGGGAGGSGGPIYIDAPSYTPTLNQAGGSGGSGGGAGPYQAPPGYASSPVQPYLPDAGGGGATGNAGSLTIV